MKEQEDWSQYQKDMEDWVSAIGGDLTGFMAALAEFVADEGTNPKPPLPPKPPEP